MISYNAISALPALVKHQPIVIIDASNNFHSNFTFDCFWLSFRILFSTSIAKLQENNKTLSRPEQLRERTHLVPRGCFTLRQQETSPIRLRQGWFFIVAFYKFRQFFCSTHLFLKCYNMESKQKGDTI